MFSYGYGSSHLAYEDKIIVVVGGRDSDSTTLLALDAGTGHTAWKSADIPRVENKRGEYSSPIVIKFGSEDQIVYSSNERLAGSNPATGEMIWSQPHVTHVGRNISTPVWNGEDLLFCSTAYASGARVVRLTHLEGRTVPEEVWFNRHLNADCSGRQGGSCELRLPGSELLGSSP